MLNHSTSRPPRTTLTKLKLHEQTYEQRIERRKATEGTSSCQPKRRLMKFVYHLFRFFYWISNSNFLIPASQHQPYRTIRPSRRWDSARSYEEKTSPFLFFLLWSAAPMALQVSPTVGKSVNLIRKNAINEKRGRRPSIVGSSTAITAILVKNSEIQERIVRYLQPSHRSRAEFASVRVSSRLPRFHSCVHDRFLLPTLRR